MPKSQPKLTHYVSMDKIRFIVFLITCIVVITAATLISFYARGYRLSTSTLRFQPNGLLVMKSYPDSAQIYINGELKTATNATIPLPPGTYDVVVRKEGFKEWNKRLIIEKEVVTESTAHLFRNALSLTAITFQPTENPVPSKDFSKLAYTIPPNPNDTVNGRNGEGLWVIELINLPLGFARDPKRIIDGDVRGAEIIWSPDGQEILLTTKTGIYLLNTSQFTPQGSTTNITIASKEDLIKEWEIENERKLAAEFRKLPDELEDILNRKAKSVLFSPDGEMVLYTASSSATIPSKLIPQLPGASTQKEVRDIKADHAYVYDIKEDRNFPIEDSDKDLVINGGFSTPALRRLSWFPTSRHLILAQPNEILIMDYDGTNRQIIYSGIYSAPHAYPSIITDRIMILTNLGANSNPPNLYSLGLK